MFGDTIERDDAWVIPVGPTAGERVEGRLYIHVVETTLSAPGFESQVTRDEGHTTVIDGTAYSFTQCWGPALDE